jgi:quercetin dioxygenase-like cupin family protein
MTKSFVTSPNSKVPKLSVLGVEMSVLATKGTADGQEITHQIGEAGMGPPPHYHAWAENFYVLRGSVEFSCDGETHICQKGSLVHVPPNTVHAFTIMEGGAEILEVTHSGQAVKAFSELDRQLPPGPPDGKEVTRIFGENGVTIVLGE